MNVWLVVIAWALAFVAGYRAGMARERSDAGFKFEPPIAVKPVVFHAQMPGPVEDPQVEDPWQTRHRGR